jgi:hypothetical protein
MGLRTCIFLDSGSPGSLDIRLAAYVLSGSSRSHISIVTRGGSLAMHEGLQRVFQRTSLQKRKIKNQVRTEERIYDLCPGRLTAFLAMAGYQACPGSVPS